MDWWFPDLQGIAKKCKTKETQQTNKQTTPHTILLTSVMPFKKRVPITLWLHPIFPISAHTKTKTPTDRHNLSHSRTRSITRFHFKQTQKPPERPPRFPNPPCPPIRADVFSSPAGERQTTKITHHMNTCTSVRLALLHLNREKNSQRKKTTKKTLATERHASSEKCRHRSFL